MSAATAEHLRLRADVPELRLLLRRETAAGIVFQALCTLPSERDVRSSDGRLSLQHPQNVDPIDLDVALPTGRSAVDLDVSYQSHQRLRDLGVLSILASSVALCAGFGLGFSGLDLNPFGGGRDLSGRVAAGVVVSVVGALGLAAGIVMVNVDDSASAVVR